LRLFSRCSQKRAATYAAGVKITIMSMNTNLSIEAG